MFLQIDRFRWALRKITLPIKGAALVLDVGAGGNPIPRADVLLDRLTGAAHRCGESMLIDRPAVFGDACRMPFKDKAFDFVIASHILEHIADPDVFLQELQRVGNAGYIETPHALYERLHPFDIHCLEVLEKEGVLHIHKKHRPVEDTYLGTKELLADGTTWGRHMFERPQRFHVRYFWNKNIRYTIDNPDVSCDWIEAINERRDVGQIKDSYLTDETGWRAYGLAVINLWHVCRRAIRHRKFDLLSILVCPTCRCDLVAKEEVLHCSGCDAAYAYTNGVPDFTAGVGGPSRVLTSSAPQEVERAET